MDPDAAYFQGMYSGVLSIQSESRSGSLAGTLKKPTRVHLEGMRHGLCKLAKPERLSQSDHPRAIIPEQLALGFCLGSSFTKTSGKDIA